MKEKTVERNALLLQANYKYVGLLGGVVCAVILFNVNVELGVFPQVFAIVLLMIAFNILHSRKLVKSRYISRISKILTLVVNVSFVTALIYYTGGRESNLWVMFLLSLISFSLLYTNNEMLVATIFVGAVYSLFYILNVKSMDFLPVALGQLFFKVGLLFLVGVSIKTAVELQVNYFKLADEVKKNKARLIKVNEASALNQIAGSIAHDLNNQLTGIIGFSRLLLDGPSCSQEIKNDLGVINNNAVHCHDIVKKFLAFSRSGDKKADAYIDVNKVLEESLHFRMYQLKIDRIEVIKETNKYLPKFMADPQQLHQVFINLINNARDAMLGHSNGQHQLTVVSMYVSREEKIIIKFTNTGPGIPPEILKDIFEPFFTTKNEGEGTGLGLSICRDIVEQCGGRIYVENPENPKVTFTIELPRN